MDFFGYLYYLKLEFLQDPNAVGHIMVLVLIFGLCDVTIAVDRGEVLNQKHLVSVGWVRFQKLLVTAKLLNEAACRRESIDRTNNYRLLQIRLLLLSQIDQGFE